MSKEMTELKETLDKLIVAYYGKKVDYETARNDKDFLKSAIHIAAK